MLKTANTIALQAAEGFRAARTRYTSDLCRVSRAIQATPPGLFLHEFVLTPASVGAVWPSSRRLAHYMAAPVPAVGTGLVVELGAGTGVVTQALLEKGIAAKRLLVIERSPAFVNHLRRRFPSIAILQGDATRLAELLPEDAQIDTIVSSLPLRSLAPEDATAIVDQWRKLLGFGKTVVQFTYALHSSQSAVPSDGFVESDSVLIWGNLPPARVMTFTRCA